MRMNVKRVVCLMLAMAITGLTLCNLAYAVSAEGSLYIDTQEKYAGMDKSYADGYMPRVSGGVAYIVLPLLGETKDDVITVTPDIGSAGSPFVYGNYQFDVKKQNNVFLVRLDLPLKDDRQNGLYPVTFDVQYLTKGNTAAFMSQSFTVYVSITDVVTVDPTPTPEEPAASDLYIDTEKKYDGMDKSYSRGYMPKVKNGKVTIILPLIGDTSKNVITVTPDIGVNGSPFVYSNYMFNVNKTNDVFLVKLTLDLLADRTNGVYPVTFDIDYMTAQSVPSAKSQSFTVYVNITDAAPEVIPQTLGKLKIDTSNVYSGMDKNYASGYMPTCKNDVASVVLPLLGQTKDNEISVTPDIGTDGVPFEYANQRFEVKKSDGVYLIKLNIPLKDDRVNGLYPVTINVEYMTTEDTPTEATQSFLVYVNIKDGKDASAAPELFITDFTVKKVEPKAEVSPTPAVTDSNATDSPEVTSTPVPEVISGLCGGDKFTVTLKLKNIGTGLATNIRLTYSSADEQGSLAPVAAINTKLVKDIKAGATQKVTFTMTVDKDAIAGKQPFSVSITYADANGVPYTFNRTLVVTVNQPVEVVFDNIALQEAAESGESVILPISMMNTGKAAIYDVTCKLDMDGLFGSSVYIGEVAAGTNGMGEMKVFVGTLGESNLYGTSTGTLTITYKDAVGNEYTEIIDMHMSILEPAVDANTEPQEQEPQQVAQPVSQWYVSVIVGVAVIAIAVAVIVVVGYERKLRLR